MPLFSLYLLSFCNRVLLIIKTYDAHFRYGRTTRLGKLRLAKTVRDCIAIAWAVTAAGINETAAPNATTAPA